VNSVAVLIEASRGATPSATTPVVWADAGVENVNALKHHWLFLHPLDSVTTVRRLVEFYVQEHHQVLPHSACRGQTPDEMYFGTGDTVPADLMSRTAAAQDPRGSQPIGVVRVMPVSRRGRVTMEC
jgi:hypothetical protein